MTQGESPGGEAVTSLHILPDRYRVERELGRGGVATVYLCTDSRDGRLVAAKVLRPEYAHALAAERFLREVEFISNLDHPFIPKVIDTGVAGDLPFYVMTYVEGEALSSRLRRERQLPIGEAVRIAREVMKPMGYAHNRAIIHRDIKPDNIIVSPAGVYVLDFGIARALVGAGGERLTRTGLTVGTPAYMSPEQALGERELDQRSDIFSLGCVMYEMIAGVPPFAGSTPQILLARRFAEPPRSLREIRGEVPLALEKAISKSMERAPGDRWPTTADFDDALRESIAVSVPAPAPAPATGSGAEPEPADVPQNEMLKTLKASFAGIYDVEKEMKGGGMSRLFLATDLELHRRVVIKILPPELTSPMMLARFKRESEVTARLQHPHILPIISAGVRDGLAHYIMPFFEGESLRARLHREGRLTIADGVRLLREVTDALSCAHEQGVIHRDIKPENILILGGHAVLADFGIAAALSGLGNKTGERITSTGMSLGTVGYMAPEQALGEKNVDGRADIYSVGVVGFEIFAGCQPFTGDTDQAILVAHLTRDPEPLERFRADAPVAVCLAIRKALQKDPASRFQTASEFHEALDGSRLTPATPAPASAESMAPSRSSWKSRLGHFPRAWRIGVPAVALAAIAAGSVYVRLGDVAATGPVLDQRRVAVLYFRDLSPRRDLGHLADAFTEDLIAKLQEVNALDVVSKDGVQQIRRADLEPDSAARVLKAGTLVEGTVEAVGDRLRVVVAVTDGSSGKELQRASFEYPARDPLKLRESLVGDVADLLRLRLGEEIRFQELKTGTRDAEAWVAAQKAEKAIKEADGFVVSGDTTSAGQRLHLADSLLSLSETRDPRWVEAIVMRGTVAFKRARLESLPAQMTQWINAGMKSAEQALGLDPRNAAALELRGTLRYWKWLNDLTTDPSEAGEVLRLAEEDLRAAVKTAPHRASAWSVLSSLFANKVDPDPIEAAMAARRAYEEDAYLSDEGVTVWRLYNSAYDNEQAVPAMHWCTEGQRRFPSNPRFVQCRLWLLTLPGMKTSIDSAWKLVMELRALTSDREWGFAGREAPMLVAAGLARAGMRDSARRVLERSRGDASVDPSRDLLIDEAVVRVILGDKDEALRLLKMYLVANPGHRAGMAEAQWWWRDLKSDPRYIELVGSGR